MTFSPSAAALLGVLPYSPVMRPVISSSTSTSMASALLRRLLTALVNHHGRQM